VSDQIQAAPSEAAAAPSLAQPTPTVAPVVAPVAPVAATPAAALAPQPATPRANPAEVNMSSADLKARLDEEREKSRKAVLAKFGVEKVEDIETKLARLKQLEDAQLSEAERVTKQIEELKKSADEGSRYKRALASAVEDRFAELPEKAREAIDEVANGDPESRLAMMRVLRKAGLVPTIPSDAAPVVAATAAHAPQPATPAAPATQAPAAAPVDAAPVAPPVAAAPANAAPTGTVPRPSVPKTKWDEYQEMNKSRPNAASLFYQLNRTEIERSRPVSA
jgi:hypothetical protein